MKFYVASGLENFSNVREITKRLIEEGFIHTYDWTLNGRANTLDQLCQIGQKEKEAVQNSDFLVVLLPGGKGTHIELGIAIGLSKRIYLYSPTENINNPEDSSTFYHLPEVKKFVGNIEEFASFVLSHEKKIN
ncbi:nucleoside 2-deoxyribosyltransferase [Bacillus mesophilus]|uniref:Group-specific protein n=1 Tax=Bacillus mesophilus TaxID=1808955 RepID=A0A6M0Q873_9BACI|nr:nucleoside 2-deoxyribosyltransferase [Bacillus mesophilus]MBM7662083.1 nucleoside 2-deoxyribosyltransferase [Bacillus mesophilus]NEY72562.1 group-specific protein [Bacillus mesophilus]